jgi:hypothetical protein
LVAGPLLLGSLVGAAPAVRAGQVVGHAGSITVTATSLRPGPSNALTSVVRVTTNARASDELDAALAAGGRPVGVYHRQVSVGEIPDLASCDGDIPSAQVVGQWLHFGPLLVPGRLYGPAPPAAATLMVPGGSPLGRRLAVTLYFVHAGQLTLDLPIQRT